MTSAKTVIDVARKEVGYHEGKSGGGWNNRQKYSKEVPGLGWSDGQPWCGTFIAWCAMKAGVGQLFAPASVAASCDGAGAWFKKQGRWSEYPGIGAQVFIGKPHDLNHTGLAIGYDGTWIYTIEGNTNDSGSREGDGVYLKKRARHGANIIGYGYPKYPGGIVNADPKVPDPKKSVATPKLGATFRHAIDDLEKARAFHQSKGNAKIVSALSKDLAELRETMKTING